MAEEDAKGVQRGMIRALIPLFGLLIVLVITAFVVPYVLEVLTNAF